MTGMNKSVEKLEMSSSGHFYPEHMIIHVEKKRVEALFLCAEAETDGEEWRCLL